MGGVSHAVGSSYANNFSFPSTDSSQAQDIVQANFATQAGDSDQIVVQAKTGTLASPEVRSAVEAMLAAVQHLHFVTGVTSPYASGLISKDDTIGLATVQLNAQAQNIPTTEVKKLIHTAQA